MNKDKKMEKTLIILKPEAVRRKVLGEIVSMIERKGFRIYAAKLITLSKQQAEGFYQVNKDKAFYSDLIDNITSGPVFIMILEREDAIRRLRELMGSTDPAMAKEGTIRQKYGFSVMENVIYGSDSKETAQWEINFFTKLKILQYNI